MLSATVTLDIRTPYLLLLGDAPSGVFAKTASGVAAWRRDACVGVWRFAPGETLADLPQLEPEAAVARGARTLVVGVAPVGGALPEAWRAALRRGLAAGLDIANGLHDRLAADPDLAACAAEHGRAIHDVRDPSGRRFPVGTGAPRTGRRVLTVGTDCAVGKMFTALCLERELRRRGVRATFRATGQTGILIAGGGVPVDAVVSDFLSGAVETLAPANDPDHWDVIEGQGSLFHPGYAAVSLGLLHGAQADALVLCHEPGRTHVVGVPDYRLPDLVTCIAHNEAAARLTAPRARVVGLALNTARLDAAAARAAVDDAAAATGLPCTDPMRFGPGGLADAVLQVAAG